MRQLGSARHSMLFCTWWAATPIRTGSDVVVENDAGSRPVSNQISNQPPKACAGPVQVDVLAPAPP